MRMSILAFAIFFTALKAYSQNNYDLVSDITKLNTSSLLNSSISSDNNQKHQLAIINVFDKFHSRRLHCVNNINQYVQQNLNLNDFVHSSFKLQFSFQIWFNPLGEIESVSILDDANHIRMAFRVKNLIATMSDLDSDLIQLADSDYFLILPIVINF